MDPRLLALARETRGFMPDDEGLALHGAALQAPPGAWVEIGTYCGKSTVYLGAAARRRGALLFTVDHHRGSEENQPGWEHHDPTLVDPQEGRIDTLGNLRRTLARARLEDVVVAVVGESSAVAQHWAAPIELLFIDGGHSRAAADADFAGWAPRLRPAGVLLIHDVFADPAEGGRPPYEVYRRALASGSFEEVSATGSLRVLRRVV